MQKSRTRDIVFIALFAVFISVCSWVSVPSVIPFTMQTFAVNLAFLFLGGKRGTLSVLVYLILGAIGLPVFSGFSSGLGVLFGARGGYLIGLILSGLVTVLFERLFGTKKQVYAVSLSLGTLLCYAAGTAWFTVIYAQNTGPIGLGAALLLCVAPFIIPDIAKLSLAFWLAPRLKRVVRSKKQ